VQKVRPRTHFEEPCATVFELSNRGGRVYGTTICGKSKEVSGPHLIFLRTFCIASMVNATSLYPGSPSQSRSRQLLALSVHTPSPIARFRIPFAFLRTALPHTHDHKLVQTHRRPYADIASIDTFCYRGRQRLTALQGKALYHANCGLRHVKHGVAGQVGRARVYSALVELLEGGRFDYGR